MSAPEKKSRKIYISGPMTGHPKHNFPAFDAAEHALENKGWNVISPAAVARENGVTENSTLDEHWLRQIQEQDFAALLTCKAIYMLRGWQSSRGAAAEFGVAKWLGLEIQYEDPAEAGGIDPKGEAGQKKAPLWLLPPSALEEAAWVHKLGADKYGPWNWRKTTVKASTYISAILRHLQTQWAVGQDNDTESGRSHLAHVVACCNILMDAQKHGCLADDRMKTATVEGVA